MIPEGSRAGGRGIGERRRPGLPPPSVVRVFAVLAFGLRATSPGASAQEPPRLVLEASAGTYDAQLRWDVGVSQVEYRELSAVGAGGGIRFRVIGTRRTGVLLVAEVRRGHVVDGRMEDRDPRETRPLRYLAEVTGSSVEREEGGLLWYLSVGGQPAIDRVDLSLVWERSESELRVQNGEQVSPYQVRLEGLDSRYRSTWEGLRISLEPRTRLGDSELGAGLAYLTSDYDGEGRWNLRDDLAQSPSFRHEADGGGWRFSLAYAYSLNPRLALAVQGWRTTLAAREGWDRLFYTDGRVVGGTLEEATWRSHGIRLALVGSF